MLQEGWGFTDNVTIEIKSVSCSLLCAKNKIPRHLSLLGLKGTVDFASIVGRRIVGFDLIH